MSRTTLLVLSLFVLAACDLGGNPLEADDDTDTTTTDDTTTDDGTSIDSSRTLPPGTASPTPDASLFRKEALDATTGNGYVDAITYDSGSDTFFVDGLAFDGNQPNGAPFSRATPGSLGPFALYEAPVSVPDSVTGTPIAQFDHRALYGVSSSGETEFAIVRTGDYIEYGFGGYIYQRNGSVVLPDEGQGTYAGNYGGIRDFNGIGGLEYVTGDITVDIDFQAFTGSCSDTSCADAVRGIVTNREIFATDGTSMTQDYLDAINAEYNTSLTELPVLRFRIGPEVADANGEVLGEAFSTVGSETFESGMYYAILAGDHTTAPGGEVVGVVVIESDELLSGETGITVRETGGFIAERQ